MPNSDDVKDLDLQVKKTVISAESFKRGSTFDSAKSFVSIHKTLSSLAGHLRKVVIRVGDLEKSFNNQSRKITSLKNISALQGPQIRGTNIGAKLPGGSVQTVDKNIAAITESVSSIAEILAGRKKLADDTAAYDRKKSEREKRALAESKLEKRFDGLKRAAEKILSPVKSILDRIINFLVTVLLGRVVYKLIEWFGDPKNAGKVKSIIRFLTDWGPALLGGFILFGTRFGKGVRILTRIALSGVARLAKAIPTLLRFARRNPRTALLVAAGTYATTQLAGKAFSSGDSSTQGFFGGGFVKPKFRFPAFSGGGFNFKNMMGGSFSNGYVSGEKGVDKVPAMLSDGEFVMSRGAVEKYGVDTLEAMNAAGGGTNKPKIIGGKTYAAGGGLVGRSDYYVSEILKGLSPQYKWAEGLAKQAGVSAQNAMQQSVGEIINQGVKAQRYLTGDKVQNDVMNLGNRAINSLQNNFNTVREVAKNASESVGRLGTSERYKTMAKNNEKKSQEAINKYDAWIQTLPKGFLKDTMNRGLIPIPTGNAFGMTGLTYVKAMLGPLGRPFKILSNKSVDKARQEMIDRTAAANGLRVGPDRKMSMEWNRVSGPGSGQYTDDLKSLGGAGGFGGGKFFNSTFGRWSGTQKGDRIVTNDVYNFNEPVGVYAKKSMDAIKKGDFGQGLYNIASMAGKFAQDVGWMNQRALGSEIDVGSIKYIDLKTGKPKTTSSSIMMYGENDPRRNQSGPYQSRFARPRNAGVKPVRPPAKSVVKVVRTKADTISTGQGEGRISRPKTPSFSASTRGSSAKANTLGIPNQASYR